MIRTLKKRSADRRARRAFTIIELLAVLVIIGILVALAVAVSTYLMDRAQEDATRGTMELTLQALDAFYEKTGEYPPGDGGTDSGEVLLEWLTGRTDDYPERSAPVKAAMGFLSRLPEDAIGLAEDNSGQRIVDGWGNPIRYEKSGVGNTPRLISAGPDGDFDTVEDNVYRPS
ncbi:MAG: type II secretion system protein [Phycisphaerae bacterium]